MIDKENQIAKTEAANSAATGDNRSLLADQKE